LDKFPDLGIQGQPTKEDIQPISECTYILIEEIKRDIITY